jgi:hypothetical protein
MIVPRNVRVANERQLRIFACNRMRPPGRGGVYGAPSVLRKDLPVVLEMLPLVGDER